MQNTSRNDYDEENDLSLSELKSNWTTYRAAMGSDDVYFEVYINIDDCLPTMGFPTDRKKNSWNENCALTEWFGSSSREDVYFNLKLFLWEDEARKKTAKKLSLKISTRDYVTDAPTEVPIYYYANLLLILLISVKWEYSFYMVQIETNRCSVVQKN